MIINPIELTESGNDLIISVTIEYAGKKERLWYSVEKKYRQYLTTDKHDGFVVGILPLAMKLGEDVVIRGTLSEKLYHNLTNYYMNIVHLAVPFLTPIKLVPESFNNDGKIDSLNGVGTGFSGGIDSFFTIKKYLLDEDIVPHYKLTHFLYCNVGSHGPSETSRQLFNKRYNLLKTLPEKIGIEFIKVDSNLDEILNISFEKTHQMRTLSCSLLLQNMLNKYYVSSGYSYQESFIGPTDHLESTDPITVHLLSTEKLEYILSGAQYSRIEKTRQIADSDLASEWLNVCTINTDDGKNCSTCSKCCRTLFTLELLDATEKFKNVFDLNRWGKAKDRYIVTMLLRKGDPLSQEIMEYAKKIGYKFTFWHKSVALILNIPIIRKLFRLILTKYFKDRIQVGI